MSLKMIFMTISVLPRVKKKKKVHEGFRAAFHLKLTKVISFGTDVISD